MKKIFVQTEVPEGEFCNPKKKKRCRRVQSSFQSTDWRCPVTGEDIENIGDYHGSRRKTHTCLSAPSAMECGHHPDAKAGNTFHRCVACDQVKEK